MDLSVLRWPAVIMALVVAACAAAVVGGRLVGGDGSGGYGPDARAAVLAACERAFVHEEDASAQRSRCGCVYDRLADTTPYRELVAAAEGARPGAPVPEVFAAAAVACPAGG
jgi:hypothetical protein